MGRLDDKVAFITGSGSGIGRVAATMFAREGARVVIAELNEASGAETEGEIRDAGGDAFHVHTDVTEPESVGSAIASAVEHYGGIHVLYNNAGGSTPRDAAVTEAPDDEFWRAIKLDLWGTFLVCKHGIPELIKGGGGSVINTSSNLAFMGIHGRDCYTAAKGGVAAITRSMAVEYAEHGVRVNAIAPAATRTERVVKLAEGNEAIENMVQRGQLLGWCEPVHIAHMAVYLASDESAVTTGQVIPVDSGATIF
jgi:NAD(P)-dependent dehydrogenase (short-subunit alcohol dehydrogenase family)